jgi:hypothetical protein
MAWNPRVVDDDKDEITVKLDSKVLRGWEYHNDDERRQKMIQAREYVEGWCNGRDWQNDLSIAQAQIRHLVDWGK